MIKRRTRRVSDIDYSDAPQPILPPDGGWGYMVILAAFLLNALIDGFTFNFSLFLPYFYSKYPDEYKTKIAFVGLIYPAVYQICGRFLLCGYLSLRSR